MQSGDMEPESTSKLPVVGFLGPVSSYTHQATLEIFKPGQYSLKPLITIQDVFDAVQSSSISRGVVPFENSTNGAVIFTLELLADRYLSYPSLSICSEVYLDVSHYLLGHSPPSSIDSPDISGTCTPTSSVPAPLKPKTKPLRSLEHVKRIYTHPQAYGQCEAFLSAYLKGVERFEVSSTSKAAEMVKGDESGESVAIASSLAAEVHGLEILARGIEDRDDNTTRFVVLRKGIEDYATIEQDDNSETLKEGDVATKSLISFTLDHRSPGALAEVLDRFRCYGINLTSINIRPTRVVPFQYIFFVEFEGSKIRDPDGKVSSLLADLDEHTQSWRWLGSWDRVRY
ncbi:hypothetical protein B7494_g1235 [Chlorociboria aeruginascens]|nr:hypothetical protein B7494_g1235 [Chlorociboria aeruginascens]